MKKPQLMLMDELLALPPFSASGVLQRARAFGGCFRDPKGMLWGTCRLDDSWSRFPGTWARFPAVQLAERTGLSEAALGEPSELWGFIDGCDGRSARGWAQDRAAPDAVIELDLSVDGRVIGQATANLFRQDLLDAGIGDGRHAFETILWTQLRQTVAQIVVAQRTSDGAVVDIAVFPLEAG